MENFQLIIDLVLAVLAALAGGTIAQRLGQPVILGYLVAGVAIGPFTPGPTADVRSVQLLAEIGVAFLMFALGAEFSLSELRRLGKVATVGGGLQILCTMGLGVLLAGALLDMSIVQGLFLGALLALSSTIVAIKVLMARGELQAIHGHVALGILIIQDLAVVPLVVVLPILAAGGQAVLADLALVAAKAGGVLIAAYLLGARLAPWLLGHVAVSRSRELFLLGVVSLALGTALVIQFAGLSFAFGAFLAGLVAAESEYRTQVVAEALPLRDLFTSLFFVSVGMLINPMALLSQAGAIALLVGVVVVAKAAIVAVVVILLGMPGRVALLAGLSLAQVGEFSFVLAQVGVDRGAIQPGVFDLTLAIALVTIILSPFLVRAAPFIATTLERLPFVGALFAEPVESDLEVGTLNQHAVICGFGRVGRELAQALEKRGLSYLAVEYNPLVVRELRSRGIPVVYGDAGNPAVIEHAHLEKAKLLAVLIPDADSAELATRHARRRYPGLDVVARAGDAAQVDRLWRAGATEVVQPEFEAGVEVIRHALERYGVGELELAHLATQRRAEFYSSADTNALP